MRLLDLYCGGGGSAYGYYQAAAAMGIDWMTGAELSQAIPPAYTRFIGTALLALMGKAGPC